MRLDAEVAHQVEDEGRTHQVDEFVDHPRGDKLAAQTVAGNVLGERGGDRGREVGAQEAIDQVDVVDERSALEPIGQIDLGVGGEHGEFGARQARVARAAFAEFFAWGQCSFEAAQEPALLDGGRVIAKGAGLGAAANLFEAQHERLVAIVAQHARRDFLGGGGEAAIALIGIESAARHYRLQQDFQVDLVVGHVDAGGIVDGVGVDAAAHERVLDAPLLGKTEVAALDHDLRA